MSNVSQCPLVLIVGNEVTLQNTFIAGLKDDHWQLQVVDDAGAAIIARGQAPALVLFARQDEMPLLADRLVRLRAVGGAAARVPAVALTDHDVAPSGRPRATQVDAYIDTRWPIRCQIEAVARWKPDGAAATLARLEAAFGRAEIRALLARFQAALIDALAAFDHGVAADHAHRLSGMAGTLGFAEVGRAWLALSEGAAFDPGALHRLTRVAITAIDTILSVEEEIPQGLPRRRRFA